MLTDDAYVYGGEPEANTGSVPWLYVGKGSGLQSVITYLRFDLSSITEGKEILWATLKMKVGAILESNERRPSSQLLTLVNQAADDNLTEGRLTYRTQPGYLTDVLNMSQAEATVYAGEWLTWDVTLFVQSKYATSGFVSLVVQMDYLTIRSTRLEFYSKESEFAPVLEVIYS